jgi:hypothetical protein
MAMVDEIGLPATIATIKLAYNGVGYMTAGIWLIKQLREWKMHQDNNIPWQPPNPDNSMLEEQTEAEWDTIRANTQWQEERKNDQEPVTFLPDNNEKPTSQPPQNILPPIPE